MSHFYADVVLKHHQEAHNLSSNQGSRPVTNSSCLEYFGSVDSSGETTRFQLNTNGFKRFVRSQKEYCPASNLEQALKSCSFTTRVSLTWTGRLALYFLLPIFVILLPIMALAPLGPNASRMQFAVYLIASVVFVLMTALMYLNLGTISTVSDLNQIAHALFGGVVIAGALAYYF